MSNVLSYEAIPSPLVGDAPRGGLLDLLLREQQTTAIEKFSQWHDHEIEPQQARYYRDLIPSTSAGEGQHYAFEVDLDACSGCKACVVACHSLNGLDEEETWRAVGLLHGGASHLPVIQHVTTACHHCLSPACLEGCPVEAYEKDPITGIVRHLDDQCIGCQYCILKCPYDAPKYSREKGIVRKCDMCSDRLAAGEAPACVQACPSRAIRISIVDRQEVAENAEANLFLPGAPEPAYTLPTTIYKTRKALPANLLPADYYSATVQHAHWPLVLMLVFTQMSVGAFLVDVIARAASLTASDDSFTARTLQSAAALGLGMLGLAASIFHLGRPWLAWRAVIGWRTSWLSREVLAFSAFALAATAFAAIAGLQTAGVAIPSFWERIAGFLVATCGLAGVACSTMVYASTRRPFWNGAYTGLKFLLTCFLLGIPTALAIGALASAGNEPISEIARPLLKALIASASVKLIAEAAIFGWLKTKTFTPLRRTALLMTGDLRRACFTRFMFGAAGGLVIPSMLLAVGALPWSLALGALAAILTLNFAGEVIERFLFFAAVVAPKMPAAPTS